MSQQKVIDTLEKNGSFMSAKDISECSGVNRTSVSRSIKILVEHDNLILMMKRNARDGGNLYKIK